MSEVHVKGLAELQKFLTQLPVKLEANVMRGALRAGMKKIAPVAKQNIHSISGELAKGLKISTNTRRGVVRAKLVATGPHRTVAHLVEYGTAAHSIAPRDGGSLFFKGLFTNLVHHPGAQAKPFMRPALDQQSNEAVLATGEYIKKRLAKKHGLDTAGVELELE